jgi:hypothetical protein
MPFSFPTSQELKPLITASNGEDKYYDFLHKDINITSIGDPPTITGYYIVPEINAMRPDLCCIDLYLYPGPYMENMLKFNNISNPFTLEGGDVLGKFEPWSMQKNTRNTESNKGVREDIRKQYLAPNKKSQMDPKLQEFDKRNKEKKKPSEATFLPPNFAAFGDKEIEIREGKVFYGENVSKTGGSNQQPLSKSEFIARLLRTQSNK